MIMGKSHDTLLESFKQTLAIFTSLICILTIIVVALEMQEYSFVSIAIGVLGLMDYFRIYTHEDTDYFILASILVSVVCLIVDFTLFTDLYNY